MYWDRYIHHNPRRIEPLDKPAEIRTAHRPAPTIVGIHHRAHRHHRPDAPRHAHSRRRYAPLPPMALPGLAGKGAVDHHRPQRRIRRRLPLDAAERVYDPTASGFDCRWLCTKEMSWELNPQKRHHRVTDLIADYHIGDTEEHRALADAIQEQMVYRALCHEATMRGKWIGR